MTTKRKAYPVATKLRAKLYEVSGCQFYRFHHSNGVFVVFVVVLRFYILAILRYNNCRRSDNSGCPLTINTCLLVGLALVLARYICATGVGVKVTGKGGGFV